MPYHPDSTTRALFIEQHIHTPTSLSKVICNICRLRCTGQTHEVVQITEHPACQCVFGRACLLQWLCSGSAASNTCPSCKAVLFNPTAKEEDDSELSSDPDSSSSDDEDSLPVSHRRRARARPTQADRSRRGTAPSPSPSRSSSSSSGEEEFHTPRRHTYNFRSRLSPSPSPSSSPSHIPKETSTAIDALASDLWAGSWDLVCDSWALTPADAQKSRSITRAQLITLILDVYPFDGEVEGGVLGAGRAVIEHLVLRARKMVHKHRKNGVFDMGSQLRTEKEDIRLAIGCGV